jgi:peptidoglycan pentaglycine glycine transferase (the first glycine)
MISERWSTWDRFVQAVPDAGFMQTSWWGRFRAQHGYEPSLLMLKSGGVVVGGALVLRFAVDDDQCFYLVPEGPVLAGDDEARAQVFEALLAGIDAMRQDDPLVVSHVRIEPRWTQLPAYVRGFEPPPFVDKYTEPRNTICIDLAPDADEILAQMRPKGRYNVRLAERHGVSIVEDSSADGLADFVSIYEDMAARQGVHAKPRDYFEELAEVTACADGDVRSALYFAELDGERLAGALVVFHGDRATYFYGGSLAIHRNVMAPYALHFGIMRRAKARGYRWYDLWGVAPVDQPDHPWAHISEFKRKFGGVEVRLVPTLDHVYDRAAYQAYLGDEPAAREGALVEAGH